MSATPAVSGGGPTGAESISDVQSLTRTYTNDAGQVTATDDVLQPERADVHDRGDGDRRG